MADEWVPLFFSQLRNPLKNSQASLWTSVEIHLILQVADSKVKRMPAKSADFAVKFAVRTVRCATLVQVSGIAIRQKQRVSSPWLQDNLTLQAHREVSLPRNDYFAVFSGSSDFNGCYPLAVPVRHCRASA